MPTYRHHTSVPHERGEVFAYHERPGAFRRLSPSFGGGPTSIERGGGGIAPGTRVRMRVAAPGTFGRLGVPWVAEHRELRAPEFFRDEMIAGPLAGWDHHHRFLPEGTGTMIEDEVRYRLSRFDALGALGRNTFEAQLRKVFDYRGRTLVDDLDFLARLPSDPAHIVLSGASGLVGTQLAALLSVAGHRVTRLVRHEPSGPDERQWDPERGRLAHDALADADHVVHLGGTPIAGRFTAAHKRRVLRSRVLSTQLLAESIAGLPAGNRPRTFVCSSAVGIYGDDRGDESLNESSGPGRGFLSEVCRAWEAATRAAGEAGVRVVNARTGLVLSAAGGLLPLLWAQFGVGAGGRIGTGRQWQSWISIDDMAASLVHCLFAGEVEGPVNLVGPAPVRNSELTQTLAHALRRPSLLPVPAAGPAALLGREGAEALALASQRVYPERLDASGYRFRHATLGEALGHVLGTERTTG